MAKTIRSPQVGNDFDFIIIGAGITGINAAYRINEHYPQKSFVILERRHELGGTWSFFKYPGIRSDSDLYTMGFAWKPWEKSNPIADGPSIVDYVRRTAQEHDIDKHIRYNHDVLRLDWQSRHHFWKIYVKCGNEEQVLTARFVIGGTGFFDYKNPRSTTIPGLERFQGTTVHPQFWSEKLDYSGKTVVVIGSGATAVTIVPVIAQKAEKTIMLQRSPSYILSVPGHSSLDAFIRRVFPGKFGYQIIAWRFTVLAWLSFYFARLFPNAAKDILEKLTRQELPKDVKYDPDFKPRYNVWDQRLCVCPDADFFRALDKERAKVVTAEIETVESDGILLRDGRRIKCDIMVTATGLKLQMLGGAKISIDGGRLIEIGEQYMWRGTMLQDVPNLMIVIGYWNNSWTLGSDLAIRIFLKGVREMERQGAISFTPRLSPSDEAKMVRRPLWNMSSTYLQNDIYPKASNRAPWSIKDNYIRDWIFLHFGNVRNGLKFE